MQRAALIVGAVVVAVLALVVLRPSDDEEPAPASAPVRTEAREENHEAPPPVSRQGEAARERARPRPVGVVARVRVRGGAPVGGVKRIVAESGDPVRISVSADAPEELHLHGYDLERPLAPGKPTVLRFRADLEGIYLLELHGSGAELAQLRVEP